MELKDLTVEEKLRIICCKGRWHTEDFNGKIPSVKVTDASMGIRMANDEGYGDKPSVSYPSSQMLANSWNLEIVREYAECVADDCLDYGADILLGPGVNIKRSPLCGRNFEYYSEDPYLAGVVAREYISALQQEGASACVKHFCANNLEFNRTRQSSEVDERTLREIYYKPFEIACAAHPSSIMCSYNRINGVQASEYKKGFDVLRNDYGFDGLIMSDWGAVCDRAKSAKAGLDLEMPFSQDNYDKLLKDYEGGIITEKEIDACAQRVLDFVYRAKERQRGKTRKHTQQERIAFTRKAEEEGIVLLKNNGVLPLGKGCTLSVCGTFAAPANNPDLITGGGSGKVVRLTPPQNIPEILRRELGGKVMYEEAFRESVAWQTSPADLNAAKSDVNLVFAGTGAQIESEERDREPAMKLSDAIERVILSTAEINPRTVVVLFAGAPIDMSAWIDRVAGVVWAGFAGECGGEAVVNVLTGKVNPSGKLTETFPLCYADTPTAKTYRDGRVACYDEGLNVGYRYYDTYRVPVLFPFGFGLSYSHFNYTGLKLTAKGGLELEVSYEIENDSERSGKEVSQVYVRKISSCVYRPKKELKGFAKTAIKAGAKVCTTVMLDRASFVYWSEGQGRFDVEDGVYEIIVGASVADERLRAKIEIENGEITVL